MAAENPLGSRRRIASELAKLGHNVDKDTVAMWMPKPSRRPRRRPSPTWRAFVRAHLAGTIAIDFLVVPTVTFKMLYVFFVLSLDRRRMLHINVTSHPDAAWTARQIVEAIGCEDTERRDLLEVLEDRYGTSSTVVTSQVPTKNWHEMLADPTIADAICDRLVHNAHVVA